MLKAKDIMKESVVTVTEDATMPEAISTLTEHGITGLPVVNGTGELVGIISEKDVLRIAYQIIAGSYDSGGTDKVRDFMTKEVVSFAPEANVADICQCFMDRAFRRVPVLEDGRLVGLISRKDIISRAFGQQAGSSGKSADE